MQAVEHLNGMVSTTLPVAKNHKQHKDSELHQRDLTNVVGSEMALRLASLTKSLTQTVPLKGKIHHHNSSLTHHESKRMKTESAPTSVGSSVTQHFISRHCSSVIQDSSSRLSGTQVHLEQRLKSSLKKLRCQQLHLSHSHSVAQVHSYRTNSNNDNDRVAAAHLISGSTTHSTNTILNSSDGGSSISSKLLSSDTPSVQPTCSKGVSTALEQHLKCLESFVDEDATCNSSDEEEEETRTIVRKSRNDRYVRYVLTGQHGIHFQFPILAILFNCNIIFLCV